MYLFISKLFLGGGGRDGDHAEWGEEKDKGREKGSWGLTDTLLNTCLLIPCSFTGSLHIFYEQKCCIFPTWVINLLLCNIYANSSGLSGIPLNAEQNSRCLARFTKSHREKGNLKQVRKTDCYHLKQRHYRVQNCSFLIRKNRLQ